VIDRDEKLKNQNVSNFFVIVEQFKVPSIVSGQNLKIIAKIFNGTT